MAYEDDVAVDEDALDVEWLRQPTMMLKYCMNAADAHRELDLAKTRLDFVAARLDKEIRTNPEHFGMAARVTEGSIKTEILLQDDWKAANAEFVEKKWEVEVAMGAVRSFEHRKTTLENLVRLFTAGYFAGPSVPHNLTEEREKRQRRANAAIKFSRRA